MGAPSPQPRPPLCTQSLECVVWLRPAVCPHVVITSVVNSHVWVRACCCAGLRPSRGGGWQYAHIHCLASCVFRQLLCSAAQQRPQQDLTCGRSAGAVGAWTGCVCWQCTALLAAMGGCMTVQTPPGRQRHSALVGKYLP